MLAAKGEAGRFVSDEARAKFFAAYDRAFTLWPQPWEEFDVETRSATTHIHRYGPAGGEPVVLLHGAGFNGSMWYPNVAALGKNHPVFAIDTPGDPNRSIQRAPIAEPAPSAAWLDEVLDKLGGGPAHLVGTSYGGWIALNQALRAPGLVATITLLDPAGLEKIGPRFYWWFYLSGLATLAPRRLRKHLAVWLDEPVLTQSELLALMWAGIRTYRIEPKKPAPLTNDELHRIQVPALLLTGKRSALIRPARARACAQLMPRAQAEIVAGAGHGPGIEQADHVNARITAFITAASKNQAW
jgi:pimeloyl-ACP methyl ester carboxylesterase